MKNIRGERLRLTPVAAIACCMLLSTGCVRGASSGDTVSEAARELPSGVLEGTIEAFIWDILLQPLKH